MTADLFTPAQDNLSADPAKNYIEELVGEGKKFRTVEDLARGKFEADQYILSQNREMDELRSFARAMHEERTTRATLEDQLTQLRQQLSNTSENTPNANEDNAPAFDPKQIEDLVDTRIKDRERSRTEQANYDTVMAKLKETHGSNYVSVLEQQIDELGLTKEDVNTLARKSPKAFFKTLGLDVPARKDLFQAPPTSERRSDPFSPTVSNNKRSWSYYQKLKETNPMIYLDAKTQVQMHKDRLELGEAFNDGNFSY